VYHLLNEMQTITIQMNKTFAWPKGRRFIPNKSVIIVFPARLVQENEQIVEIIEAPDDAEIGFQESDDTQEVFSHIILKLPKGGGVRVNRSSKAILLGQTGKKITFRTENS
jgi:hypothetical protein